MNNSNTPKISIITCFLNVEKYIRETIESVLALDYQNWELILIDDGSTDKSTEIAKEFATKYSGKIIYVEHENHKNKGASASRNLGIKKATGTLITFLDADDIWLPDMLSNLLNIMQQHPETAMVCEASEYWYDWNDSSKKNEVIYIGAEQDKLYQPPQLILTLYPLGDGAAPCICGMLIKKEIADKHGSFDDSFKGMYDDQSFLIKLYLHEKIFISSTHKNKYRQRSDSLVHSSHSKRAYLHERKNFLIWLKSYMKKNAISHPEVNFRLQQAFLPYTPAWFVKNTLQKKIKRALQKAFNW